MDIVQNADLKVLLTRDQAAQLLAAIPAEYSVESSDPEAQLSQGCGSARKKSRSRLH
jgi:hypothetical protein